jgi:hypothetical protein
VQQQQTLLEARARRVKGETTIPHNASFQIKSNQSVTQTRSAFQGFRGNLRFDNPVIIPKRYKVYKNTLEPTTRPIIPATAAHFNTCVRV